MINIVLIMMTVLVFTAVIYAACSFSYVEDEENSE